MNIMSQCFFVVALLCICGITGMNGQNFSLQLTKQRAGEKF